MHSRIFALLPAALLFSILLMPGAHAAGQLLDTDAIAKRVAPCMSCHGKEGRATSDGYYPRIAGKPAGYLYNQLLNFREGRRQQYPLMVYMVQHLSNPYLQEMAEYFSSQHVPYPAPAKIDVSPAVLEQGRTLIVNGDPGRQVPACIACHGEGLTGMEPAVPGLVGIPRDYINAQFGAWREGTRHAIAPDCMANIAQQLTVDEIAAISAWLASQPVPPNARPAKTTTKKLPLPCGSAAH